MSGWSNNVVTTGTPSFFTAPTGTNPSFVPASGDTQLTGRGAMGNGVPTTDIGFDPKCLVRRTPVMVGAVARVSSWQYDIDIDYIKSIGGVAKCFNVAMRSGTPDIGAYRAGAVTTLMPGNCVPPPDPPPMGGMGGMAGMTGMAGDAGASNAGMGGAISGAGMGGVAGSPPGGSGGVVSGTGGAAVGGATSTGGVPGSGGTGATSTGGSPGGAPGTSGSAPMAAAPGAANGADPEESAGCGCRIARSRSFARELVGLALLTFGVFAIRRRRRRL
jgi:hypothetical protein